MKIKAIALCLAAILLLGAGAAGAQSALTADYAAGAIHVYWNAQGDGVLTLYSDGCPVSVCAVGGEGEKVFPAVNPDASYAVTLKDESGSRTVEVNMGGTSAAPAPERTQKPAAGETSAEPMPVPTAAATPAQSAAPIGLQGGQVMTSLAAQVISETNAERAKHGLAPLTVSAELTGAAKVRAQEIVRAFSHTRPDGTHWSSVTPSAAGENIAKGHQSAGRVMAAWMTSEGHRANILRGSFGSIGVCALKVDGIMYWVQLFGR